MRGEDLNHIPAAPEPALGTGSCLSLGCVLHGAEGEGKSSGHFSDCINVFNPNYCSLWDPNSL